MDIAKHVFQFHAVDVDTAILSASSRSETMWLTSLSLNPPAVGGFLG
jgi:hypothetical protein